MPIQNPMAALLDADLAVAAATTDLRDDDTMSGSAHDALVAALLQAASAHDAFAQVGSRSISEEHYLHASAAAMYRYASGEVSRAKSCLLLASFRDMDEDEVADWQEAEAAVVEAIELAQRSGADARKQTAGAL